MGAAEGAVATGAFVGDDDGDGPPRAEGRVHAPHLVAGPAPLAAFEQHRAHRPHPRPHWLHVHQRPVSARPTCIVAPCLSESE